MRINRKKLHRAQRALAGARRCNRALMDAMPYFEPAFLISWFEPKRRWQDVKCIGDFQFWVRVRNRDYELSLDAVASVVEYAHWRITHGLGIM